MESDEQLDQDTCVLRRNLPMSMSLTRKQYLIRLLFRLFSIMDLFLRKLPADYQIYRYYSVVNGSGLENVDSRQKVIYQ